MNRALDRLLRLRDRRLGERAPLVAVPHLELKARPAGAARADPLAPPYHPISRRAGQKLEVNLHIPSSAMNQRIEVAAARAAPERPGDRVDQARLAVTVVAAQTGEARKLAHHSIPHAPITSDRRRDA